MTSRHLDKKTDSLMWVGLFPFRGTALKYKTVTFVRDKEMEQQSPFLTAWYPQPKDSLRTVYCKKHAAICKNTVADQKTVGKSSIRTEGAFADGQSYRLKHFENIVF